MKRNQNKVKRERSGEKYRHIGNKVPADGTRMKDGLPASRQFFYPQISQISADQDAAERCFMSFVPFVVQTSFKNLWKSEESVDPTVLWTEQGQSADEIVSSFPQLSLADVHAALAFYFDHQAQIDADIRREEEIIAQLKDRQGSGPIQDTE